MYLIKNFKYFLIFIVFIDFILKNLFLSQIIQVNTLKFSVVLVNFILIFIVIFAIKKLSVRYIILSFLICIFNILNMVYLFKPNQSRLTITFVLITIIIFLPQKLR